MNTSADDRDRFVLGCDVGNSRVKFGLFSIAGEKLPACRASFVSSVSGDVVWDDIRAAIPGNAGVSASFLAGSNPRLREELQSEWPSRLPGPSPRVITNPVDGCLKAAVDEPGKVGVDRLLNAIAANAIRPADVGAIIIDSGTATTVDVVDPAGAFCGGAILPGFELSARSLHHYTALLPLITIEQLAAEPHEPRGTNTRAAMHSGLFWGQLGAVRELIARLSADSLFRGTSPALILTGGGAAMLAEHLHDARCEPHLSLQGLVLAGLAETMGEIER